MYINGLAIIRYSKQSGITVMVRRFAPMRTTNFFFNSSSKHLLGPCRVRQVFESKVLKVQWQRQGAGK